jgi:hypothetical protein
MRAKLPRLTERQFQRQVIQLARLHGWRVAHFRPARTLKGWRTPVEADGRGFPDILCVRGKDVKVIELKVGRNVLTPEQAAWIRAFDPTAVKWHVFYPRDWAKIEEVLR